MVNLRWDVANWVTILLMVAIGYAFFGLARSFVVAGPMSGSAS